MLMTIEELISELRLSRATIYRIIKRDGFPAPQKFGRTSRWIKAEVVSFVYKPNKDA